MAAKRNDVVVTQHRQVQSHKTRPTAKGLGITTEKPKFPHYALVSKRQESYVELEWPQNCPVSIDSLVEAGLVYTGVGDSVRCFHCGGGLRNWEGGDDPMIEHARWYPNCAHVILVKGAKFIKAIAEGEEPIEDCGDMMTNTSQCDSTDNLEHIPAVQAALEMGFANHEVMTALRIFRLRNGNSSFTGRQLCEIVFEIQDNPDAAQYQLRSIQTHEDDSDTSESEEDLIAENERLKENQNCKICLESRADVIFLPCGHMVSCGQCATALEKCPICRKVVNGLVKAFFAVNPT